MSADPTIAHGHTNSCFVQRRLGQKRERFTGGALGAFAVRLQQIDCDDRHGGDTKAGLEGPVVVADHAQMDIGSD